MKTLLGYAYKDSGMYSKPNMTGYYMGDKQSTPGMKTGGQAKIARAEQYTGDQSALGGTEIAEGLNIIFCKVIEYGAKKEDETPVKPVCS